TGVASAARSQAGFVACRNPQPPATSSAPAVAIFASRVRRSSSAAIATSAQNAMPPAKMRSVKLAAVSRGNSVRSIACGGCHLHPSRHARNAGALRRAPDLLGALSAFRRAARSESQNLARARARRAGLPVVGTEVALLAFAFVDDAVAAVMLVP